MKKDNLYTIGDVAKLMNISIYTLRYYDQIDLFKPAFTDPKTNYRYYEDTQLFQLDWIKSLRSIGTPLEKIHETYQISTAEQLHFLDEQEQVVNEQLSELTAVQKNIAQVRQYLTQQLDDHQMNEVYVLEAPVTRILVKPLTKKGINPRAIENSSYSDMKHFLEEQHLGIHGGYGGIFPYRADYASVEEMDYHTLFTPLFSDKWVTEIAEGMDIGKIPGGRYAAIRFEFSPSAYVENYQKLCSYIEDRQLQPKSIYEFFTMTQYAPEAKSVFIIELRIRLDEA